MNTTSELGASQAEKGARPKRFETPLPSRLGRRVLEKDERAKDPGRELGDVELLTYMFRTSIARAHTARVREVDLKARVALEEWTDVVAGEAPPIPCKNWKWRAGAVKPARREKRCAATKDFGHETHRCSRLAGHEGEHEIDRTRVKSRELLRECAGVVRDRPCLRLHGHKGECSRKRPPKWDRACACALCTMHESVSSVQWHEGRERGQRVRFESVRKCGSRMMTAACGVCGKDRRPIPEGCGVRRVCDKCDTQGAIGRRSRFGRARGRVFHVGHRYGLTRRVRAGGRYTEKMLTLTIPHSLLASAGGIVREKSRDDLHARVVALFEAWPRFLRKVNRHWRDRRERHATYHRAFEWTPGKSDAHGHPHFHVYLWCPWIDARYLTSLWAEALREVGWPVGVDANGFPRVRTKLQMLRSMNVSAVRELMKGGKRQALTLSRIDFVERDAGAEFARGPRKGQLIGPGIDAFKYAEGWTLGDVNDCAPDVIARLYMALEARRLTQASRAFFLEDERASCECCGASRFIVRFEATPEIAPATPVHPPRGPPNEHARIPPSRILDRLAGRVLGGAVFTVRDAPGHGQWSSAFAPSPRSRERLLS